jgi:hydroxymethylbilane synthase
MNKILRIATRKSPLALWQAHHIGQALEKHWSHISYTLVPMQTSGDTFLRDKLQTVGGKGLFVKELEEALLQNKADLAVHSMKDVPAELPAGLQISTICKRDNPQDAFLSLQFSSLHDLPAGSTIGTSSLRRQSQLLSLKPDCKPLTLRGNINTRFSKLESGEYDAIILAAAGLERLSMQDKIKELIPVNLMLPACAQGALGIECSEINEELKELLIPLNDPISAICIQAERQVNARLGGNCHVPLAVFCQPISNQQLQIQGKVMSIDGQTIINDIQNAKPEDYLHMANLCADALLSKGAKQLLAEL